MERNCVNKKIGQNDLKEDLILSEGMQVFSSEEIIAKMITKHPFRPTAIAILLITKGEIELQCNFVSYKLSERDLFFVFPDSLCEIEKISDNVSFLGIAFHRGYLKKQGIFFSSANFIHFFSKDIMRKHTLSSEEYKDIQYNVLSLKRKIQLPEETLYLKEIIRHNFVSVLYEIFLVHNKNRTLSPVKINRREELASDFLALLSENFKEQRKLYYYAKELFVTPRHLSQVVKQVTGKTAGELIDELVIKEAKVLLSSHLLNVAQVSDLLHFSDQSFFGKFFKKHTGFSPSLYKESSNVSQNLPF